MHLEECLNRIPVDRLRKLAGRYMPGIKPGDRVNTSILSSLLLDTGALKAAVVSLTEEELAALRIIVFACSGRGVVVEQCHQKLNRMTRKWRRNGALVIDALMQLGLVFTERAHYRQIYFVPGDLRQKLTEFLGKDLIEAISVDSVDTVEAGDDPNLALRNLHFLLSYIRKQGVRVTQNGEVFRRSQKGLGETLGIPDLASSEQDNPLHIRYMLDYLRSRGLVRQAEGYLDLVADKVESWLSLDPWQKRLDVFHFWEQSLLEHDSDLSTILGFLQLLPASKWARVDRLVEFLEPVGIGHSWQALPARLEKAFFRHLASSGVIWIGRTGDSIACCLTPMGRLLMSGVAPVEEEWEYSFFVEPNFELLVPRDIHPNRLWEIERVADLIKNDHTMVYLVTRTSIYRALKDGHTAQQIVSFLQQHSKNPVPQNVAYSIENWCTRFGRLCFVDALILHCDCPELAAEIRSATALREYILGSYTDTELIIDRQKHESFVEALQEHGFMPLPGVLDPKNGSK